METYRLQYASDLHLGLETPPFNKLLEPVAPDLALCGDIGDPFSNVYYDFIRWVSSRWTRVFLLAGNHEYFSENPDVTMRDTETQIRKVAKSVGNNVFFLQKDIFRIESHKIIVIGATLWTIPDLRRWNLLNDGFIGDPGYRGDYKVIHVKDEYSGKNRPVHPSDITKLCSDHSSFLSRTLNPTWGSIEDGWRVIVLTHHLPTFKVNDLHYKDNILKTCYAVELDSLIKEPVVLWVCGHSHKAIDMRFDSGCLVTLNPLGYKTEYGISGYNIRASVNIYRENIAIVKK
jgi:hypothetical protein